MNLLPRSAASSPREWIKLALIPVLGLVLLTLLWGSSAEEAAPSSTHPSSAHPSSAHPSSAPVALKTSPGTAAPRVSKPAFRARTAENWPTTSLEHVTRVNPFGPSIPIQKMLGVWVEPSPDPPPAAPVETTAGADTEAAAEPPAPAAAAPQETPPETEAATAAAAIDVSQLATLQAISESNGEFRALINSRIYRPGDRLLDDFHILEITADRVTVIRHERMKSDERMKNGEAP